MTTIPSAITSLLYDHDTVIVPGLGAFIRHDQSAHVNVITNEFQRPSSSLAFDPQQREENALVSTYLMTCDGLTDEEARTAVAAFVNDCFSQLKAQRSMSLPELGILSYDDYDNLVFEPVGEANFNGDAFGLEDLTPQPVFGRPASHGDKIVPPAEVTTRVEPHPCEEPRRRTWWIWLLLLMIAVGVALWYFKFRPNPDKPDHDGPELVKPIVDTVKPVFDTVVAPDTVPSFIDTMTLIEDTVSEVIPEIIPEVVPVVVPETTPELQVLTDIKVITPPAEAKAFIVGGCFSIEQNALNMSKTVREEGCSSAFVMKRGTRYYVCYGYYSSTAEAKEALPEVLENYNAKAWILKK